MSATATPVLSFGALAPRVLALASALFGVPAWGAEEVHTVPHVPSASAEGHVGLVRIESRSAFPGEVRIVAVDDAGRRVEAGRVALGAEAAAEFDARALESGDAALGLPGTGSGEGGWRLELTTDLDIGARAYARSAGLVAALHDAVLVSGGEVELPLFHPAGDARRSILRLINAGGGRAAVAVRGIDDAGRAGGSATVELGPWEARSYTALELESGSAAGLTGSLGDGEGNWRLLLSAERGSAYAVNLLLDGSGTLSSVPGGMSRGGFHRVLLFPSAADDDGLRGVVRVVNRTASPAPVSIEAFDETDRAHEELRLSLGAGSAVELDSADLEHGNADKGLEGSTGPGEGDWWLELWSAAEIEALSYLETASGMLSPLRGTARIETASGMRYEALLRDGSGELRLLNAGGEPAEVRISGVDDAGSRGGAVEVSLAPWSARTLTASALAEGGASGVAGALGTGTGSWRLALETDVEIDVLGLAGGSGGALSDLSRRGRPAGAPPRVEAVDATEADADLWVSASASPAELSPGEEFELSATVGNRGGRSASPTTLRYYWSADDVISNADAEVGADSVMALAPDDDVRETLSVRAPLEPGTYHYGGCADGVPEESNAANNCSASVRVVVTDPGPPAEPPEPPPEPANLVLSASAAEERCGRLAVRSRTTVRNEGPGTAAATTLRYYRSSDAAISSNDEEIGTARVPSLAPQEISPGSLLVKVGAGTGHYYACVDPVRNETDVGDNCSVVSAVTTASGPTDVIASDFGVKPQPSGDPYVPGDRLGFAYGYKLVSDTSVEAYTGIYRSEDSTITTDDTRLEYKYDGPLSGCHISFGTEFTYDVIPSSPGVYYFGACVDAVEGESDTTNNCTNGDGITVR